MDYSQQTIQVHKFRDAFRRMRWIQDGNDRDKEKWVFEPDHSIWTFLPTNIESMEYRYFQVQNIKLLIYSAGLPENNKTISEFHSQLLNYSYNVINRIVNKSDNLENSIPIEVANTVTLKNIHALRSYYITRTRGRNIPIEKFRLNHTEQGSFIIPISISAEYKKDTLTNIVSDTNLIIREFLDWLDKLTKISHTNEKIFADEVLQNKLDSKVVKDYLSTSDGIARINEKYSDEISEISLTSRHNPILDFGLEESEKIFKTVSLGNLEPVPEEFISYLEKIEVESDTQSIREHSAKINVLVDSVNLNGSAKFRVVMINGEPVSEPFKASTQELSKDRLNLCADAFISQDPIVLKGDLQKVKGKIGKIIVDDLTVVDEKIFEQERLL